MAKNSGVASWHPQVKNDPHGSARYNTMANEVEEQQVGVCLLASCMRAACVLCAGHAGQYSRCRYIWDKLPDTTVGGGLLTGVQAKSGGITHLLQDESRREIIFSQLVVSVGGLH